MNKSGDKEVPDTAGFCETGNDINVSSSPLQSSKKGKGKKKRKPKVKAVSTRDLFRFATRTDYFVLFWGVVGSIAGGAIFPLFAVLLGDAVSGFFPYNEDVINDTAVNFAIFAALLVVANVMQHYCFSWAAANQIFRLRQQTLRAVMGQEMGWFDTTNPSELSTKIAGDTVLIEDGMGFKLGELVKFSAQFISGYIIGFVNGWQLAIVMAVALPVLVVLFSTFSYFARRYTKKGQEQYGRAGGVVEETFSSIRTTASLGVEEEMYERFSKEVTLAETVLKKGGTIFGLCMGLVLLVIFLTYALGWWYAGKLIYEGNSQISAVGDAIKVFFGVMVGSMSLAQVGPNVKAFFDAKAAAVSVMEVLDRHSEIDPYSTTGTRAAALTGDIVLDHVSFSYPSRPNVPILRELDLTIKKGSTVALVGASGSGKSTVINLLQRFYDATGGVLTIGGQDVRTFNIQWLRSQMGLVGQEPVLFNCSIAENIAYGAADRVVSKEEIISAAKRANAHTFIESFPDQYDTEVGDKGVALSGGQKQRIAIARAIVGNPQILLLDEATSALDTESEKTVQAALDDLLMDGTRTCIVVAHRLSTIRNADVIAVFNNGLVIEKGTHDELMQIEDGFYRHLLQKQIEEPEKPPSQERIISQPAAGSRAKSVGSRSLAGRVSQGRADEEVGIIEETDGDSTGPMDEQMQKLSISRRLMTFSKGNMRILVGAVLLSILSGAVFPSWALLLTDLMNSLGIYGDDKEKLYSEVKKYASIFCGFAFVVALITFSQNTLFTWYGESLTTQMRLATFKAMVRQNIGWFDEKENSVGSLAAKLATEAPKVRAVAGQAQGQLVQNMGTLVVALVIAYTLGSWQLSTIMLAIMPVLVAVTLVQYRVRYKGEKRSQKAMVQSGQMATQQISAIRTVTSFNLQAETLVQYGASLELPRLESVKKGVWGGVSTGLTNGISFWTYSLVFWYGGQLVGDGKITFDECMKSLMCMMFAAMGLAQSSGFMADSRSAQTAAKNIFSIIDRQPVIDIDSTEGKRLSSVKGSIEFRDIIFTYPTRPGEPVLRRFNLRVAPGQTVALVGESGSGKSTIVQLLERFYDPDSGHVLLDNEDITGLNLQWYRSQLGLVGQEPHLYQGTIAENIRLGSPTATLDDVISAAKMANADTFIMEFPDGYNTQVGDSGAQLSGGQKQRIAIARAIVKNPSVLLLDEATSALDAESESVVQKALDDLMKIQNRTTIIIAHRLSTIRNADVIVAVSEGKVGEAGTHEQLLAKKGLYYKLHTDATS